MKQKTLCVSYFLIKRKKLFGQSNISHIFPVMNPLEKKKKTKSGIKAERGK